MRRKKRIWLAGMAIALLLVSGQGFCLSPGEDAAMFVNPDLSGEFVFSKDLLGESWILLDFFATWCKPCQKELPELESIHQDFGEKGLVSIVFAVDEEGERVVYPYFQKNPTSMMVLIDKYRVSAQRYGVEGIPVVFLVNPEGKIEIRGDGYSEETIELIHSVLQQNLGE